MADISINFIYLNGEESILSFPCNFTFHDLNWYNDSYISLFHIGDYVFIDKCELLSNYSEQTIYVIKKQRTTLLPWIDKLINPGNRRVIFKLLSSNINAIQLLEKNIDNIDWRHLSSNINAIPILDANIDKIDWYALSRNVNAISILEANIDKINWNNLSANRNAISLLEANIDKINWDNLSTNKNALHILEKHIDKINIRNLLLIFENEFIFE